MEMQWFDLLQGMWCKHSAAANLVWLGVTDISIPGFSCLGAQVDATSAINSTGAFGETFEALRGRVQSMTKLTMRSHHVLQMLIHNRSIGATAYVLQTVWPRFPHVLAPNALCPRCWLNMVANVLCVFAGRRRS
jgi:hypothetical protein